MQNQLEKSHKVFQLELIAGKNAAVIWGEWDGEFLSAATIDKTIILIKRQVQLDPNFLLAIPHMLSHVFIGKSLILAKCSVSCGHSLGFQQKSLPKSWMKKQQETHLEHNLGGTTNAEIGS